eukprot:gene1349-1910_t
MFMLRKYQNCTSTRMSRTPPPNPEECPRSCGRGLVQSRMRVQGCGQTQHLETGIIVSEVLSHTFALMKFLSTISGAQCSPVRSMSMDAKTAHSLFTQWNA